jgi:ferritin-like metal-binding protein YciE
MPIDDLEGLFIEELKDLHSAEAQIVKALPKMVKAASSPPLKAAFESHLEETVQHVERLNRIFETHGLSPKGKTCKGMAALLEEGQDVIDAEIPPEVKDAALIAAAQRVEHYEMAVYGSLRTFAQILNDTQSAKLLQQTLEEEGKTDRELTQLAQWKINVAAGNVTGRT